MSTSSEGGGEANDLEDVGTDVRKPGAVVGGAVVLHVANLARIAVREDEVPRLAEEMQRIVSFFESLDEVDTEGVVETSSVQLERMRLRPDRPVASLARDAVLQQAPRVIGEGFAVPGFVDE